MNKVFVIISTLIICSSCSIEQLEKDSTSTKIDVKQEPIEVIDELKKEVESELKNQYFSYKDTVLNGTYKYQMDFSIWLRDEKDFTQFARIERNGDSLIFRTAKKRLVLVNEEYDEETQNFEAPAYRFVKLYKKDSNGFKLIKTILLNDWGIAKASWISNNRLLISKATIDEKYDMHYKPGVLSLDMK